MSKKLKNAIKKFDEAELEEAIIQQFDGYAYSNGENLHREEKDVLIYDDLKEYLKWKYNDLTDIEIETCIRKIDNIPSTPLYEAAREIHRLLVDGFDFEREDKNPIHIDYINFDDLENNNFKIVNQYAVTDVRRRRPDLILFINGIPICIFEFKTAIEENKTIYDAYIQIHNRYKRDIPSLLKYTIMSVVSDGVNTKLGTIFTPYKFYYSWNRVNFDSMDSKGIDSLESMIKGAFSKDRLLQIFRDFVFFPDESKKEEVIICRYPQFFGANLMLKSIEYSVKNRDETKGKGGTYFGATGCGKTYTMLYLARLIKLRNNDIFNNPTIVILVDRDDLDTQTSDDFINAKKFLCDENVRSIVDREDLGTTLRNIESGGLYITTIQKFNEGIGLLSDRKNIICISDEAHRTQSGINIKLKKKDGKLEPSKGFGGYLRDSFPNATYVGFTGTPTTDTINVFGEIKDMYTMRQSSDDGITVRISYEPRLARVILNDAEIKEIEDYYHDCEEEGSNPEQIEKSKKAMSSMAKILSNPDTIDRLSSDIIEHYTKMCSEKPNIIHKAMIVCANRPLAYQLLKAIIDKKKEWGESRKYIGKPPKNEILDELVEIPFINLVATRSKDDDEKLYKACGDDAHRDFLEEQFKNENSNFRIAVVVDMWTTGFDVEPLFCMYIYKPLQKHTLIQTISRVNRIYEGKDKGKVVDYIGIKNEMLEAVKQFGDKIESPIDEIYTSISIFRNYLKLIDDIMINFDNTKYREGSALERLQCLNLASEYVQEKNERQKEFMDYTKKLKAAYNVIISSSELTNDELIRAQFYFAIRSIIYKQTRGNAPDAEVMNAVVEEMVEKAISCTGVESIIDEQKSFDFFSEKFLEEMKKIKLPITKFNALLKLVKKAISDFAKVNNVKSLEYGERLKIVVDKYNNRDSFVFTSEVVEDFINSITDELIKIYKDLSIEKKSFENLGITYEEKAFYDILVKVRDEHQFPYKDEKCVVLAKEIKKLVDDKTKYADFFRRSDVKSQLDEDLTVLLYNNGYPPEWDAEVFEKVMKQAEYYKKHNC